MNDDPQVDEALRQGGHDPVKGHEFLCAPVVRVQAVKQVRGGVASGNADTRIGQQQIRFLLPRYQERPAAFAHRGAGVEQPVVLLYKAGGIG